MRPRGVGDPADRAVRRSREHRRLDRQWAPRRAGGRRWGSNITITRTGATSYTVSDPAGNLTGAGPNCTPAGPTTTVTCQNATQDIGAFGKAGDDRLTLAPGTDVVAHLFGNGGTDVITGGTQADDLEGATATTRSTAGQATTSSCPATGPITWTAAVETTTSSSRPFR